MWRQPRREALVRVCRDPLWYGIEPLFLFQRECLRRTFYGFLFLWSKTNGPSGGDFTFTRTVHFGHNAKMEYLGPFCWLAVWCRPMLVRGDKRRAGTSLRDMLRFYFAYLIFGGAFYLFLFAGDVATVFSTPPLVVNLVCSLFCLD